MHATKSEIKDRTSVFNRLMYCIFLLLAAYFIIVRGEYGEAAVNLGIALIFDPFNPAQPWAERPVYQRTWLILHLCLAALLVILHFTR